MDRRNTKASTPDYSRSGVGLRLWPTMVYYVQHCESLVCTIMQSSAEWEDSGRSLDETWGGRESNIAVSEWTLVFLHAMLDFTLNSCRARSQPQNIRGSDIFFPLTFSGSGQELEMSQPHTLVENIEGLDVRWHGSFWTLYWFATLQYSMILSMHWFVGFSKVKHAPFFP